MESPSPALLRQAKKLRFFQGVMSGLDRYLSFPLPPRPALDLTIPTTISNHPGSISLYIYTAPGKDPIPITSTSKPRPVLINFHGGGFSIGHAIDDARWAHAVLKAHEDSFVVSVNYRLAPEHPFPIPMEDCVDAIIWLWEHARSYNLDRNRFVLCGNSAGGNLALTVPLRLYEELEKRDRRDTKADIILRCSIAFYPSVDWTRTRDERDATNPVAAERGMIPPSIFEFFDKSYLVPENLPKTEDGKVDMGHPYLSPGLTPTNLLLAAFPGSVAIYTCGWDQLLVEGDALRERICKFVDEGRMKHCGGFMVEDAIHGFDKRPTFCVGSPEREKMFADAIEQLGIMWRCEHEDSEDD
ncbi:hypothetical protein N7456_009745 [Penicillium angulare]|uniref:Alpha/beta hydrolase fold-3 domain-containing protein n=1 Tax=Penicillium angulare TaxID=116970 RepID=A0A9W9K5J0_9EURO|nr:hypothetical protein N7456_009745 [Penicillium angulare]